MNLGGKRRCCRHVKLEKASQTGPSVWLNLAFLLRLASQRGGETVGKDFHSRNTSGTAIK